MHPRTIYRLPLVLVLLVSIGCSGSEEPAVEATEDPAAKAARIEQALTDGENGSWRFGGDLSAPNKPISDVLAESAEIEGQAVAITGKVVNVCQASGCWVELEGEDGKTLTAFSLDHTVLLPKNSVGREVTLVGKVLVDDEGTSMSMEAAELKSASSGG